METSFTSKVLPSDPLAPFAAYPFAHDAEYQQGIAGILASGAFEGKSEEEKSEIILQSEVFYYNRLTGSSLTVEDARRARQASAASQSQAGNSDAPAAAPSANGGEQEPQMLSFAQLKALIEQGRTDEIPNNKTIPNILSSDPPSESKAAPPKKPWELSATA